MGLINRGKIILPHQPFQETHYDKGKRFKGETPISALRTGKENNGRTSMSNRDHSGNMAVLLWEVLTFFFSSSVACQCQGESEYVIFGVSVGHIENHSMGKL